MSATEKIVLIAVTAILSTAIVLMSLDLEEARRGELQALRATDTALHRATEALTQRLTDREAALAVTLAGLESEIAALRRPRPSTPEHARIVPVFPSGQMFDR